MERKAQAMKDYMLKQPKAWLKSDHVKDFTDFILPKDIEEDGGYDSKEMLLEVEKNFIEAAKKNDVAGMKLLGRGVNVNAKNVNGRTALHYAVAFRNVEAVDMLLRRRAKLDLQDKEGLNMMHCAAMNNHTDIVAYIVDDLQIGELDKKDQYGNRPFALAAAHGCVRMLEMLMEESYNMATMEENEAGDTPLHLAAKNGQCEALQLLLNNFDIRNEVNQMGQTALHIATEMGKVDVVEMILKAGVDLEIRDRQNKTALGVAARGNMVIIVDMIIKAERYFRWKHNFQMTNTDAIESLHSESPLTFKLDHSPDTKPVRDIIWDLAYKHLKRNDWKKLAEYWEFTDDQVAAIEEQWTGPNSFQEHGNRMLLIWLHGILIEGSSPSKGLYEGLLSAGITKIAEKIRMEGSNADTRKCMVS
ncbi:ankyrin repeat and death domain-containing 1B [Labeo rohita]|uniref:Ankyrin repeat and death domain-containing 1B n=1 Tax=Labeo rohita TaxID=84645 RepID=A0A498NQ20_LABRO|nr:ankyrin repeat and death domain-containing 1B [Labeo rohita]RXN34065.1 ankyrin repeat and death domain-containing 1B [Labeo rohita]